MNSPLETHAVLQLGPLPISAPVLVSWGLTALLTMVCALATRKLSVDQPGRAQLLLEWFVTVMLQQISDTMRSPPRPWLPLIGTLFLFILLANLMSLVPGVEPPTAALETDAALALIVFVATIAAGVRAHGVLGYLRSFAAPSWVMLPMNLVEQLTRTFSLMVRLFGNVMSGVFIVGILLSLAGLIVPIPFMALEVLTGTIQAYIFTVLGMVFIASAMHEGD